METQIDAMAMAQLALLEPSWLPHPNHGYLQDQPQELASILRHVVAEQDGNTNPTHQAILFLMDTFLSTSATSPRPQPGKSMTRCISCEETMPRTRSLQRKLTNMQKLFKHLTSQNRKENKKKM